MREGVKGGQAGIVSLLVLPLLCLHPIDRDVLFGHI